MEWGFYLRTWGGDGREKKRQGGREVEREGDMRGSSCKISGLIVST